MERTEEKRRAQPCRSPSQITPYNRHRPCTEEQYYPEDILIEKLESGEYGWLDFVNHHSAEWQEEYLLYCKENDFLVGDPSAEEFVHFKDRELEYALENGDA